jgi:hypothetical protein
VEEVIHGLSALQTEPYFVTMKATMTRRGQLTIPSSERRRLGLKAGQVFDLAPAASLPKAPRVIDLEKARAVIGCAKARLKGRTSAEWIEWLRGPVELPPDAPRRR